MSKYIPTEWFNGDTITAEKLNKIENSIKEVSSAVSTPSNLEGIYFFTNSSSSGDYGDWYSFDQACRTFLPNVPCEEPFEFCVLGIDQSNNLRWYTPNTAGLLPPISNSLRNWDAFLMHNGTTGEFEWITTSELAIKVSPSD